MMTGTGMTTNLGDTPAPFGQLFRLHELQDLQIRLKIVSVSLFIGVLYSILLVAAMQFSLIDLLIVAGTVFLGFRTNSLINEISQMKQYLHGEGVHALE
mgnify:FL=1|jgi:hypothetical protein